MEYNGIELTERERGIAQTAFVVGSAIEAAHWLLGKGCNGALAEHSAVVFEQPDKPTSAQKEFGCAIKDAVLAITTGGVQ